MGWAEFVELAGQERADVLRDEDGGHAIVDGGDLSAGLGGDHGEDVAAFLVVLPDAGDPEEATGGILEAKGDLSAAAVDPFVEGGGGDEAAALGEGLVPGASLELVLAGVDDGAPELLGFPAGDGAAEAPSHFPQGTIGEDDGGEEGGTDDAGGIEADEVLEGAGLDVFGE